MFVIANKQQWGRHVFKHFQNVCNYLLLGVSYVIFRFVWINEKKMFFVKLEINMSSFPGIWMLDINANGIQL